MKFFRKILAYIKSVGTYFYTLFQRRDHLDWEKSPLDEILKSYLEKVSEERPDAKMAMYCYKGNHQGEVFLLSKNIETLGVGTENTQVLTPASTQTASVETRYQVILSPEFKILAQPGHSFVLNGIEQREAELYDFDELEVFDNQFLVLDLSDQKRIKVGSLL